MTDVRARAFAARARGRARACARLSVPAPLPAPAPVPLPTYARARLDAYAHSYACAYTRTRTCTLYLHMLPHMMLLTTPCMPYACIVGVLTCSCKRSHVHLLYAVWWFALPCSCCVDSTRLHCSAVSHAPSPRAVCEPNVLSFRPPGR